MLCLFTCAPVEARTIVVFRQRGAGKWHNIMGQVLGGEVNCYISNCQQFPGGMSDVIGVCCLGWMNGHMGALPSTYDGGYWLAQRLKLTEECRGAALGAEWPM